VHSLSARAAAEPRDDYRLLATMLTGAVATVEDRVERAEETGHAWGRYLVRRPPPARG